jgi:ABC-type uncharacterized transport system substrate-binding protein
MQMSRRKAFASLAAISAGLCRRARAASTRFIIVTASREGPHAAAISGLEQALAARSIATATFQLPADDTAVRKELNNGANQLTIAVGVDAVRAVASANSRLPLIVTMVFRADHASIHTAEGNGVKLAGAVWLDLPVSQVVTGVRVVFPNATRLAVARNPSQPDSPEKLAPSLLLPAGVSVTSVQVGSAPELVASIRKLRGQVEFMICLPDSNLYNKTTVESLILASLEHKLPLVGYSVSFVRAGAVLGVYPDFGEVGRQTAALAERYLSNLPVHEEYPQHTNIAVNERVLHLLGRSYEPGHSNEVLVIR